MTLLQYPNRKPTLRRKEIKIEKMKTSNSKLYLQAEKKFQVYWALNDRVTKKSTKQMPKNTHGHCVLSTQCPCVFFGSSF